MKNRIFPLLITSLFFVACQAPPTDEKVGAMKEPLSEEEMRMPENALAGFKLHEGIALQQFASEPMLINPTNLDIDERGRVWICEAQNYRGFRNDHPQREAGDRILILEDEDGDGKADLQKVFYQGTDVNSALGIAKLGNKIYVAASPSLLVFTDENGDDIPDKKDTLFTGLDGVDHDHGVHAVVFGPDGKLYFNYGNEGKRLRLKSGELAIDKQGKTVEEGKSFKQGMIFRCNADGSDLEILGHNFRNNYEVAVDAYGAMWQSDNDDDGNQATRINFVMDYGNYGFKDQVTGAGWRTPRIGMHDEIPKRHWHLNDPGVVPNLLQTGAGSPTGILVYEGDALPDVFRNQMIHCEPGKNVVRSYPVTSKGAGYSAEIVPLVTSSDAWFRPSDVCAAPDGSVLISDWYDAGVGGHLMADIKRGRIYRVHSPGQEKYLTKPADLSTAKLAVQHLNHVNQATRYLAFQKVVESENAVEVLRDFILATDDPRLKARAYWCLASIDGHGQDAAIRALGETSANLRMAAFRMGRQFLSAGELLLLLENGKSDEDPGVLREMAISLRFIDTPQADVFWTNLAQHYDGSDRWFLEALGIGSDLYADRRLSHYLRIMKEKDLPTAPNIIWRLRSDQSLPHLYEQILESENAEEMVRFFRAMHFLSPEAAETYLTRALQEDQHPNKDQMVQFALGSLSEAVLQNNKNIQARVREVLPSVRGTDTWPMVVRNANLKDEAPILLDSALVSTNENFRKEAITLVSQIGPKKLIRDRFTNADLEGKLALVDLVSHVKNNVTRKWMSNLLKNSSEPDILRHRAAKALANDWQGMEELMVGLETGEIGEQDAGVISAQLSQTWRSDIRQRAIAWITKTKGIPPINLENIAMQTGDAEQGFNTFTEFCQGCHQVNNQGQNFGPDLSQIGDKLGKDGLLSAIVYPSLGVGFGYEGFEIKSVDGNIYNGFIESQTEDELTLRMMGGLTQIIPFDNITEKRPLAESLMTANLHQLMTENQLVDLVEYLTTLRASEEM